MADSKSGRGGRPAIHVVIPEDPEILLLVDSTCDAQLADAQMRPPEAPLRRSRRVPGDQRPATAGGRAEAAGREPLATPLEVHPKVVPRRAAQQPLARRFAPRSTAPLLRRLPGWALSLAAHVLLLLLLGLVSYSTAGLGDVIYIESSFAVAEAPELQELTLEMEVMPLEELAAAELSRLEPTLPSEFGEPSVPAELQTPGAAPAADPLANIGEMVQRSLGATGPSRSQSSAEFFGVRADGHQFVFVVDSSGSMNDGRFAMAKQELLGTLRRLEKNQRFYVVFFDQTLERMRLTPGGPHDERAAVATPENIAALERWVASVTIEAGRDPLEALELAIEMLPDAIYLLSDGVFSAAVLERLRDRNTIDEPGLGLRPLVPIHTVAFLRAGGSAAERQAQQTAAARMRALADQNGGSFRLVWNGRRREARGNRK